MSFFTRGYGAICKIRASLERKLGLINQTVEITDILVTKNQEGSRYFFPNSECSIDKLSAHIKYLGSIANNYHETTYLSTKNHKNKVTRLITNEFSFYPSDRPLTMDEFKQLLGNIETIATKFHPNVMLVLSSFPVLGPKNEIYNFVVHVQSGPIPKIDTFCKAQPSHIDLDYLRKYPLAKYSDDERALIEGVTPLLTEQKDSSILGVVKNFFKKIVGLDLEGLNINYGGIINCETLGGAKFTTAIDICLDHLYAVAKNAFKRIIAVALKCMNSELLPDQVSHVVTSDHVYIDRTSTIVTKVTQADPYQQGVFSDRKGTSQSDLSVEFRQVVGQSKTLAPTTKVMTSEQDLLILDPPFGPDLKLIVCEQQPLARLTGQLKEDVDAHNATAIYNMTRDLVAMQSGYSYSKNKKAVMDISNQLSDYLDEQSQQQSFFKKLFGIKDTYSEQLELVKDYMQKIARSAANPECFNTTVTVLLANFKQHAKLIPDAGSLVQEIESIEQSFTNNVHSSYQQRSP